MNKTIKIKRFLFVLLVVFVVALIGYLCFTGSQLSYTEMAGK